MFDDKIVLIQTFEEKSHLGTWQGFSESAFFAHVPICHFFNFERPKLYVTVSSDNF
jgi:hypothetical protein